MAAVLGVNAVFHDPAAALVVDGRIVAAAEEERFSRVKHGKAAVPFSTWEMPERSMRWCLAAAGLDAGDLDAITYSYDPALLDGSSGRSRSAATTCGASPRGSRRAAPPWWCRRPRVSLSSPCARSC